MMITIVTVWLCLITHVACDVLITVNNNGSDNDKCCVNGTCPCSSLSSALHNVSDNTVINITSESVTLHDIVGMGSGNLSRMGSGNLSNITITGNGATIMCNNTGGVYCESCSDITIMGITWYQCGCNDSRYPVTQMAALGFTIVASDIHIQGCTFLESSGCPVYVENATGYVLITESSFQETVCSFFIGNSDYNICPGLYLSYSAQIALAINNSRFDNNDYTGRSEDLYFYFGVVIDSLTSSNVFEHKHFLFENTNFSRGFWGISFNDSVENAIVELLNVNMYYFYYGGIYIDMSGATSDSYGSVIVSSSTFKYNNWGLLITADSISISSATFVDNSVALRISVSKRSVSSSIEIESSTFTSGYQGIDIKSVVNLTSVTVINSFFHNFHKEAVSIKTSNPTTCITATVVFTNVTIYNITDDIGVHISTENTTASIIFTNVNFISNVESLLIENYFTDCYHNYTVSIQLIDCVFYKNAALHHVVSFNIIADNKRSFDYEFDVNIELSDCLFNDNIGSTSIVSINTPKTEHFYATILIILDNSTFSNNRATALYLLIPEIHVKGNTLFVNNSATNGAAVYLEEVLSISSDDNAIVQFINNSAEQKGGAMYINLDTSTDDQDCDMFWNISNVSNLSFINNSAGIAGNSIYFSIPQSCQIITDINNNTSLLYWPNKFNYSQSVYTKNSPIVTSPYSVKLYSPAVAIHNFSNDYSIQQSKMLGEPILFTASVFDYFKNITEPVTFSVKCSTCIDYILSMYQITVHDHSIHELKVFPITHSDIMNNINISLIFRSALSPIYKFLFASLSVELSPCRAGYVFNCTMCSCYPHPDLVHCKEDYVEIKIGYWIGYLTQQQYTSSICPNNYCSSERRETSPGYYRLRGKPDDQCSSRRTGVACGKCKSGYTLAYDSPDCINTDKCSAGMTILVIVLTILYWIAIVAVVFGLMYFHFQISSGYAYGIIYYYSIVDILLVNDVSEEEFHLVSILSSFAKLTPQIFGQLCLVEGLSGIDQQFIHYCHALAVSLILLIIVLVARYSARLTRFVGPCIIRVICLLLLLSYTSLASTSLQLLRPLFFNDDVNEVHTYSSPDIKYFTGRHLVYAIVAILCEVIIVIGLPLFLLLEPFLRRRVNLVRIKPLIDQFQGCYTDKYRWFAAYYLICRQVIILIVLFGNENYYYYMLYGLQTACVIIAMIHVWVQPYKSSFLNGLDGVILLILVLVVNLNLFTLFSTNYFSVVLVMLPLLLVCLITIQKLFNHFFKRKRHLRLYDPVGAYDENDNRNNERR